MRKRPLTIATCCLAGALLTAVPVSDVYAAPLAGISEQAGAIMESELNTSSPVAGISLTVSSYLEKSAVSRYTSAESADLEDTESEEKDTKSDKKSNKKADSSEKNQAKTVDRAKTSNSKYDSMAVAQVSDYVNIRKAPNEDAKLLGKLYSNSVATVLKKKGDWYKVQSGTVTGYVKGDYIVVGDEDLVKSVGTQIATVSTTTLKVRSKASAKSEVLTLVPGGEALKVASMKDYKDGWVKVAVDGGKGYVSSDYIELNREYTYAESREEEEARLAIEQARIAAAEEEARRAREAEAAANAGTDSTGTGSSTGTSTGSSSAGTSIGSSGTSSSSSTGSSSTDSSSSGTDSSSASTTSGSGQAVVNYASQFLGNSYVYGGSSLTNGTDCSGFVMSVYAHFGVSLPHSSSALRSVGYGVSYDSMQPGDIICYNGHVGIYVGGNTIIHASNPATGIKYTSPANYRTVVAVRRIF